MTTYFPTPHTHASGNHLARRSLALLALGLALGLGGCSAGKAGDSVTLEVARAELESGRAVLIDIRESNEHAGGIAAGAQLLPMRQISTRLSEIPTDPNKPVLLICNTQNRSSAKLDALREKGYSHVRFVQGGMSEWMNRGWPVVKPPL